MFAILLDFYEIISVHQIALYNIACNKLINIYLYRDCVNTTSRNMYMGKNTGHTNSRFPSSFCLHFVQIIFSYTNEQARGLHFLLKSTFNIQQLNNKLTLIFSILINDMDQIIYSDIKQSLFITGLQVNQQWVFFYKTNKISIVLFITKNHMVHWCMYHYKRLHICMNYFVTCLQYSQVQIIVSLHQIMEW